MTLKEVRKKFLGLTQDQMAVEMGVSRRTYVRYETGSAPAYAIRLATHILKAKTKTKKKA